MKKPTKKELWDMSDRTLLTDYDLASERVERSIKAIGLLPGYSTQALRIQDRAITSYDAYRAEILRRMGGAK